MLGVFPVFYLRPRGEQRPTEEVMQSGSSCDATNTATSSYFLHLDDADLLHRDFGVPRDAVQTWQQSAKTASRCAIRRYATCCIVRSDPFKSVGSASSDASAIDASGAVFRLDREPVRGFESEVGSRTTFRVTAGDRHGVSRPPGERTDATTILFCPPIPRAPASGNATARIDPCWSRADGVLRVSPRARVTFNNRLQYAYGAGAHYSTAWARGIASALCERVTEYRVPLPNLLMRRPSIIDAAVALQISGHIQDSRGCSLEHMQAHVAACRARFRRCDVYMHTWSTLHPQTASWHTRPSSPPHEVVSQARARSRPIEESSEACMVRIRQALRPLAAQVEEQPRPPRQVEDAGVDSLAPDGLPFNQSGTLTACSGHGYACNWGPARLHSWNMSLLGMALASRLRAASGSRYDVAIRIRPDERVPWWDLVNKQGWNSHSRSWLQRLWNCVALFALAQNASSPNSLFKHSAALPALLPSMSDPRPSSHETVIFDPRRALMACGSLSRDWKGGLNEDQCFFATPATIDAVLVDQFQFNYPKVYADVRRGANAWASSSIYRAAGAQAMSSGDYWQAQELQFVHAIRLAGMQRARMCYGAEVEWRS